MIGKERRGCYKEIMTELLKKCCLMSALFLLVACGATKPAVIGSELAQVKGYEETKNGLRIYIRPLQDKNEIKKYFGADLLKKNILPIFVLAENRNDTAYFLVEPAPPARDERIDNGGGTAAFVSAEDAKKSVYKKDTQLEIGLAMAGPIFWLALIPIAMADYGPTDASKSLQQALITQSLRKQTLSPGKTEQGFIYYQLPPDDSSAETIGITLQATNIETQDVMYFSFTNKSKPGEKR